MTTGWKNPSPLVFHTVPEKAFPLVGEGDERSIRKEKPDGGLPGDWRMHHELHIRAGVDVAPTGKGA